MMSCNEQQNSANKKDLKQEQLFSILSATKPNGDADPMPCFYRRALIASIV
jgi:hypothetical protein